LSEPLYLRSVEPTRNRFRAFTMVESRSLWGEPALLVSWGRLGSRPRVRVETFPDVRTLERRRAALLKTRLRHGYERVA
jgi:predicted DNA-binding WGR domain protein